MKYSLLTIILFLLFETAILGQTKVIPSSFYILVDKKHTKKISAFFSGIVFLPNGTDTLKFSFENNMLYIEALLKENKFLPKSTRVTGILDSLNKRSSVFKFQIHNNDSLGISKFKFIEINMLNKQIILFNYNKQIFLTPCLNCGKKDNVWGVVLRRSAKSYRLKP